MIKRIAIFISIFLFFSIAVMAREVTLQWDANSEPDLKNYVVYWGIESRNYNQHRATAGLETTIIISIPDDGKVYYFAVTAVDTAGLESDYSNEVNTGEIKPHLREDLDAPGKFIFKKSEKKD
jgi:fibronectin type 3 domain-containing protein